MSFIPKKKTIQNSSYWLIKIPNKKSMMSIPQSIKSINQTSTALNPEGEKTSEKKKKGNNLNSIYIIPILSKITT